MELQWIDDFLALAQTRNFTRAAEARCTTQSAYSRRVQRLEEWLGAPLFYRESRPVTLTPAGEEFMVRSSAPRRPATRMERPGRSTRRNGDGLPRGRGRRRGSCFRSGGVEKHEVGSGHSGCAAISLRSRARAVWSRKPTLPTDSVVMRLISW